MRKGRGWFVQHERKQVYLSHDEREAKELFHKLMLGLPLDDESDPSAKFPAVATAYLSELKRTRSERHYESTRWRLDQLAVVWEHRAAASLKATDVTAALEKYPQWGPTTQAQVLGALKGCLAWASRAGGMLTTNPLPKIAMPRRKARSAIVTDKELKKLLAACYPELRPIVWALAQCGARPGELCRAKAEHCDPDGAAIRLPTGKQGRRLIFFPPTARAKIKALRAKADPYLFVNAHGRPWDSLGNLPIAFKRARDAAKLGPHVTAYALRHSWISQRLREGVPIATVARMAGTSVAMIDQVYGHLSDQDLRAVADEMG